MRTKKIKGIKFGLLSPKEIRKMSAANVITADTYGEDGFPIELGLVNQRLGVIDPGLRCKTCGGRMGDCPGHFGYIELAAPVIHIGYAKLVYLILNATCRKCGRVLLDEEESRLFLEELEQQKEKQVDIDDVVKRIFKEAAKKAVCTHCGEYFGIDAEGLEEGMNMCEIPPELRERIEERGYSISKNADLKRGIDTKCLFNWREVPGSDSDRLRAFLMDNFGVTWVKNADITKSQKGKQLSVSAGKKTIEITISAKRDRIRVELEDGVSYELPVKKETGQLNVYNYNWELTDEDKIYILKREGGLLNIYCGERVRQIKYDKPTTYREIDEEGNERRLMPTDVRERLERIPDDDLAILGMDAESARPEWVVLTVLPVPPVTARPSITLESGQRSEDDLTHKLVDIIRINQRFMENRDAGAPQLIIEDLWELLQYHVSTYFDNDIAGVPPARHRSGRPLKTMAQRLKGKEGRFRGSLSGKRVNFSARTVISPDPDIDIGDVGVPDAIAKELTITVNVTERNLELMRATVRRGRTHPGANYVRRTDGKKVKVTDINHEALSKELDVGWKVERHLVDGDIVLFNRQPSLHRLSIMAHYVRVMSGKTFRLNPSVCPPYNADYDGDEMNMHVLQTEEARAEAKILMAVQRNIISPRFGRPIIGGIHDYITGIFLLTRGEKRFEKGTVLDILENIEIDDLGEPEGTSTSSTYEEAPYWTNKQIFSMILPDGMDLQFRGTVCEKCIEKGLACEGESCPREAYVLIRDGKLISGVIDEAAIGSFKGLIIDRIYRHYGELAAKEFINNVSRLAINYILQCGFSFGISDEDISKEGKKQISEEVVHDAEREVDKLIKAYEAGELESLPGRSLEETLELLIMEKLGRARDEAGDIAELYLGIENPGVLMAKSGARGSMLNLTQMAACVGQQSVRGERIRRGYQQRTLPHFKPGDRSADARGFVKASFKDGLSPTEYFFHAVGGREALVDTAVRTSQSGYFQRRLINALQDLEVKHDGTVRETRDTIVQFEYGEDGVDPSKSEGGKVVDINEIIRAEVGEQR
ncbi:MAG: DNA-directed RNA polymerase subunit A' [Halobacteriota archaeon]